MKKLIFNLLLAVGVLGTLHAGDPVKPYPLTTCIVSGEKLGGMGDPYVFVHEGQE